MQRRGVHGVKESTGKVGKAGDITEKIEDRGSSCVILNI